MTPTIDAVEGLLALLGSPAALERDGEPITIAQHCLQCAAILRAAHPEDEALQVAGLVHDVGTVLAPGRPASHAATGAHAVGGLLGERVAALVADHDRAKRYLVTVDAAYRSRLSARSIETLDDQGGLLDARTRTDFEASPHFHDCVALRRADDAAKVPDLDVGSVDEWRGVIERVARVHSAERAPG